MSAPLPQPENPFTKKIVHVFLGRGHGGSQKIQVLAPYHPEIEEIECSLLASPFQPITQVAKFQDEIIRLYQFEFRDLIDAKAYGYRFTANGKPLELGGGLKESDLHFQYWSELKTQDSLIHMSCNGLFFYGEEAKMWDMWRRLSADIENGDLNPKLLVLGGDQYYQDEIEHDWFNKMDTPNFPLLKDEFKRASLENALKHWEDLSYRKIMARVPSVAMLDDHDITDGASGHRKEFYSGTSSEFNEKWLNFSSVQKEIFSFIQASRNPRPSCQKKDNAFSFVLELGETALVALDLRTEKNARTKVLQAPDSKVALFNDIKKLPQKNVMILIPVVPIRNSQSIEKTALSFAQFASAVSQGFSPQTKLEKKLKRTTDFVAGLEDDITDALCSDSNKDYLFELFGLILDGAAAGVNYTILSGDIHTAGSVELHLERKGQLVKVPILVSSPIAYQPMNFIVECLLKEKKVIEIHHSGISVSAVNHAFSTNRNFMEIFPDKLVSNPNEAAALYEEGIPGSKTVLIKGWNHGRSRAVTDAAAILRGQEIGTGHQVEGGFNNG